MLFTSVEFIIFICVIFVAYYLVPKRAQWILLLAASMLFYYIAGVMGLVYMGITIFANYLIALKVSSERGKKEEYFNANLLHASLKEKKAFKDGMKKGLRKWLILCILINVGLLFVLKYMNFTVSGISSLILGTSDVITFFDIAAPMGISFYMLSALGYVIDVSRGKHKAEKNPAKFALYVSFFPVVVQGPILRFEEVSSSLFAPHAFDRRNVMNGVLRIAWGYFKKLVIADRMLVAVSALTGDPEMYQGAWSLLLVIYYTIEIYADFTGGIDITIGIAQVLGIKLPENFVRPFFSKNIAEYWRRWHISMGAWFRDYLFYPISASKTILNIAKKSRKALGEGFGRRLPVYISTMVVWLITGIWHGASFNFVMWGILNGVVIIISQELTPLYDRFGKKFPLAHKNTGYKIMQAARTVAITASLRLLDLNTDVGVTFRRFFSIFYTPNYEILTDGSVMSLGLGVFDYVIIAIGIAAMLIVSLIGRKVSVRDALAKKGFALPYISIAVLCFAVLVFGAYGTGYDASQFIYNQF